MPEPPTTYTKVRDWLRSDDARQHMEWCFDQWQDHLTSAEQQHYDGWIGEFILQALADRIEAALTTAGQR